MGKKEANEAWLEHSFQKESEVFLKFRSSKVPLKSYSQLGGSCKGWESFCSLENLYIKDNRCYDLFYY
jgi:hypothetical protein